VHFIIVGAGEVGSNIAASLADQHEVVVIDLDEDRVDQLTYSLDVLALEGDGTDIDVLREAGIDEADILIASTNSDEANIVTCGTARTVSDAFTVARVRKTSLLRTWQGAEGAFGVDYMVSVDLLTAHTVVQIAGLPGTRDVDTFADGAVRMAEFEITEQSPVAGQTVREADRYDPLTFAALFRDGNVTIPKGDTVIEADDRLVVIGSVASARQFANELAPQKALGTDADVVVIGGGEIGYHVARLLGEQGYSPQLIESDPERAREIAEELPETVVLNHDPTDLAFLEREHVGQADVVVTALEGDERNLLITLLADRIGADRTIAIVETGEYVDLFEAVGVGAAVNPRKVTAEEITRFTRAKQTENVAIIESDRAEVLEIEIDEDSILAGRPIQESIAALPDGIVVGAITRGEKRTLVTPRGSTTIEVGDFVVLFVDTTILDEVEMKL
jgi:trk system potassium uptake protein TrkA